MTKMLLKRAGAASLVAALAMVSVPAEAAAIKSNVPFTFTVNGKTLAPGTYEISNAQGVLTLRSAAGHGAFALANRRESAKVTEMKLVFHKYGTRYFLREAWMGGGNGHELPSTRLERELARLSRDEQVAAAFERIVIPVL